MGLILASQITDLVYLRTCHGAQKNSSLSQRGQEARGQCIRHAGSVALGQYPTEVSVRSRKPESLRGKGDSGLESHLLFPAEIPRSVVSSGSVPVEGF